MVLNYLRSYDLAFMVSLVITVSASVTLNALIEGNSLAEIQRKAIDTYCCINEHA